MYSFSIFHRSTQNRCAQLIFQYFPCNHKLIMNCIFIVEKLPFQAASHFIIYLIFTMKKSRSPIDTNPIVRWLHLHTLQYVFELGTSPSDKQSEFPQPRFQLFRKIPRFYVDPSDRFKLFKNILLGYRWQLSIGLLLTVIYASLNLLLSQIIKQFMQVMQHSEEERVSSYVTQKFVILQILRIVFGLHMKRMFQELAIKVESTISKRLVKKALFMEKQYRKLIPQTQIYQYENVDLKLIYNLFNILYLGVEIPFTIGVAIIWLFSLNTILGIIASYWFMIIFLMQRALDDRMRKCNLTKLKLIDQRSKINYQFMERIHLARIIREESLIVQKNNDLFLQQNHDHTVFYRYSSLYDIAQLLLPIAVVVTSLVFDHNYKKPMTVEQLYLILSLLGICYRPMKDFRTFSIALSDGFHSLRRMTQYLELPQEPEHQPNYTRTYEKPTSLTVAKGTVGTVRGATNFDFEVKFHIQFSAGERVVILGRKGQGSSTFLNMLVGEIELKKGSINVQGKIAYLSEQNFFLIDTLQKNLSFYNQYSLMEIDAVYHELGLSNQMSLPKGLQEIIEENKFNQNQLKLISLARVFCSKASIFVLDNPFDGLNAESSVKVEKLLRKYQDEGTLIIMTQKKVQYIESDDKIIIVYLAVTKEYGLYKDMIKNQRSYIDNFVKNKVVESSNEIDEFRNVALKFQNKVRKAMTFSALFSNQSERNNIKMKTQTLMNSVASYTVKLKRQAEQLRLKQQQKKHQENVSNYFLKFLRSCKLSQSIFILIIIISVEVLHIFIHFYIGHEYQHRAKAGIKSLRTLMFYEVVLTLGLSGLIYLEGQVSSYLAVITGNKLYKQSLQSLVHKELRWYGEEYSLRTADKFNHDYEQIFITVHSILTLYKNAVILVATALFVGGSHYLIIMATIGVGMLYFAILALLRRANSKILKHYYDFKYEFVKVFSQSIEGASLIKVYDVGREVVEKAKIKYTNLASYKLAASYVSFGQSLMCDITSTIITAFALEFGTNVRVKKAQIAVLATAILLLLNLADVLKAMVDAAIQVEIFFKLNILPFMKIVPAGFTHKQQIYPNPPTKYDIFFDKVYLKEENEEVFEVYPIKMKIKEGETVCIYEQDQNLRDNLLFGLTKNIITLSNPQLVQRTIFIGSTPISQISSETLRGLVGVILHQNFYFSGTLKENLSWRTKNFDQNLAVKLAKELGISQQLKEFTKQGLATKIQLNSQQNNLGLSKKLAVLRVLLRNPKIVIIKDTHPFIDTWSIVELIRKYNPLCTIIKITNTLEVAFDVNRIVLLEKLKIVEDGNPKRLQFDRLSKIGEMLRQCNEEAYIYRNRVSMMPKKRENKQHVRMSLILHTKNI